MECGQIKEDLFNRQLWVLSSYPDSIAWSNAGAVASITNDTVHVHTAKFEYMATYKVKWISLERKPVSSQPEGMQPDKHSTLTDWIRENSIKDGGTHICAATWSDDLRSSQDHSPLLILLLTDGTLLLLSVCDREVALINVSDNGEQVCNRAKEASYPVECYTNTNCSLNLHGMSVVLDCATTYKTYCTERHLDITKQRVRCSASFTLFATNINQKTCILLLASHDRVTIWRMHYIASTYNSESNYGPVNYDMRGQQVQLRMDFLSECTFPNMRGDSSITSLLVSSVPHENATVSATTNIPKESINVLCGTNDGDVHSVRFDLSLSQSNSSSSAPLARVLTASAIFVRKLHVLGTPINTMHFVDEQSTVCFVSGACVQTVPLRILISPATEVPVLGTSTALVKKGSISGLVVLPRNDLSDRAHRSSVLVCSTYGELKVHQFTPTPEPATATAAGGSSAAGPPHCSSWTLYRDVPNKANGYSMFGVASDSTGLFTAYLYRTPAIHYNTREVQLNNCLRWPRSAISWKMSPFLEQDFSASVHQTATVLLRLVRDAVERAEKDTVSPQVSFAALPMVFLQSLECDGPRAFYRSKLTDLKSCEAVEGVNYYPKVPSTVDVKQEGSSAAGEDYDSGDDGEGGNGYGDDDSDSGDSVTASAAAAQQISSQNLLIARTSPSDLYAFGAAAASRSEKKKFPAATGDRRKRFRRRVSNMTAVYERVGQLARPNRQEAVQLAVETIFDAAVLVALSLQQGDIFDAQLEELLAAMDLDQKIEVLFTLPPIDDGRALASMKVLWQCLHLLLLSLHRTVGIPEIGADFEHLPACLRQVMHRAHCIQSLQRLLAHNDGAAGTGRQRLDLQSVHFMTEVLAHHLSSLPSSNSSSSSSAVASTDPVSNPLQALVSAVQHWLQQTRSHSGSNTGSSSSSSCLKQLFGNEVCALCASNIVFQPYDDHSEETSAQEASTSRFPPKVKGASVLYGTCETCTMRVERCCFSLRLVTTSAEDCGVSTTGAGVVRQNAVAKRMSEKVYRCELCSAVTSLALYRTVSAPGSLVQNGSSLFCPYCSIPMYPL